jgi:hypothetical protein
MAAAGDEDSMTETASIFDFLAAQIADVETQWSLGTFGAIAEFMRDKGEPVRLSRNGTALAAVTARGGIRIAPPATLRPFAYETTTRESWSGRVALCLPDEQCAMNGRRVLTELAPDADALRSVDRGAILFDLGLGARQVDVCVRVSDPDVAARLRVHAGQSVFAPGNPAMGVILAASPHRVFVSRLGRAEVFAPIPPADGKSPDGPHTHVLPDLLRHGRSHAATEPIPAGWIPCAHIYPAHPARDGMGNSRPFDAARHDAFQEMLLRFGDPRFIALKKRVAAAVTAGEDPAAITLSQTRFARTHIRVALRQLKAANAAAPALAGWIAAHERGERNDADADRHRHHR